PGAEGRFGPGERFDPADDVQEHLTEEILGVAGAPASKVPQHGRRERDVDLTPRPLPSRPRRGEELLEALAQRGVPLHLLHPLCVGGWRIVLQLSRNRNPSVTPLLRSRERGPRGPAPWENAGRRA